jgi:predicted transcriptional regulator
MRAKPAHRDREATEVAVLDALADRREEGMSVFELRSQVDVDIDRLETALAELKADDLIEVEENGERTVILPNEDAVGPVEDDDEIGLVEALRERFGL